MLKITICGGGNLGSVCTGFLASQPETQVSLLTRRPEQWSLQPEVIDPDDVEMLSDLIMAATNEALRTAAKEKEERMDAISGGLNIPGLF